MPMDGCRTPAKHVISQENPVGQQLCKLVDHSRYKSVILSNAEDSFRHTLYLVVPASCRLGRCGCLTCV